MIGLFGYRAGDIFADLIDCFDDLSTTVKYVQVFSVVGVWL
jgi:hypothetical protein